MKKIHLLLLCLTICLFSACHDKLWDAIDDLDVRVARLEELCKEMNTNIVSIQTIVNVVQSGDYITGVTEIKKDGEVIGYTITFGQHDPITIYHGQDGKDGADGKDGQDGQNGSANAPVISVAQDTDGVYYWTLNGEWLLDDNGNKLPVSGKDGQNGTNGSNGQDGADGKDGDDGQNGKDGITPQLKIEEGYWYISYDNGATWTQLGKATGEDGKDGVDGEDGKDGQNGADGKDGQGGDSMFQSVTQDDNYVYFTLADGTVIKIAKGDGNNNDSIIHFEDIVIKAICVANWDKNGDGELSKNEACNILSIGNKFASNTNIRSFRELQFFSKITEIPVGAFEGCSNLFSIEIPENVEVVNSSAFKNCTSLVFVKFLGNKVNRICGGGQSIRHYATSKDPNHVEDEFTISAGDGAFGNCTSLKAIHIPSSVQIIEESSFAKCTNLQSVTFGENSQLSNIKGTSASGAFAGCVSLSSITIPANVDTIGPLAFGGCTGLSSLNFESPSDLKYVGGGGGYTTGGGGALYGAFCFCPITNLHIPSSVNYIGHSAFYGCQTNNITIPSSVIHIGAYAFSTSSNTKVICEGKDPALLIKDNQIEYSSGKITDLFAGSIHSITVPYGSLNAYQTTEPWSSYSSKIVENDY